MHSSGQTLYCDICIIGAGAAGIVLAHRLRHSGLAVLLVESGPDRGDGAPLGGDLVGHRHPPLDLYRVRRFGGSTGLWGGRCVPLDAIDFTARPWIPHSSWPITAQELEPYYRMALEYCEAGPWAFTPDEAMPPGAGSMVDGFTDGELLTDSIERFSRPTDFGTRYGPELRASPNLRIVTGATCTRLLLDPGGGAVQQAEFKLNRGETQRVEARYFCLAAGGLESTRLLLESDVGQRSGLLGRFYMCHIEGKVARLRLADPRHRVAADYERDRFGIYVRRRWALTERAQQSHQLANMILRIEPPPIADPAHRSGIYSAMFLSRVFVKEEYARRLAAVADHSNLAHPGLVIAAHMRNVATDFPVLAAFAARWRRDHVRADRKLPFVLVPPRDGVYHLDYNAEQRPNPDSRVSLGNQRDADGRRQLRVDWQIERDDVEDVVRAFSLLAGRVARAGIGQLDFDPEQIRSEYYPVGGHHIGTTRMAEDDSQGVVDRHCQVFGVANLFVASSSVMPTSGHANPTLTIVALALRLVDRLVELSRRPMFEVALSTAARPVTLIRKFCHHCGRYALPRQIFFRGQIEKSVCPACGHALDRVGA